MKLRSLILCALLAAMTAVGSLLRIPLPPSAITLQLFFALLSGMLLGPQYGPLSQALYLALGLFGLPLFAAGSGAAAVVHPTFGFLLGLPAAAWAAGRLTRRSCTAKRAAVAGLAGTALVYAVGLPYMAAVLGLWDVKALLWAGMLPFLPGDALKIALCVLLAPRLRRCSAPLR